MKSLPLPSVIVVFLVSVMAATACTIDIDLDDELLSGSGQLETRSFDLPLANAIDLGNGFRAEIVVDPNAAMSVEITLDDNLFEALRVDVIDEELRIDLSRGFRFNTAQRPLATITVPKLERIGVSGGAHATAEGVDGSLVLIDASGGSVVRLSGVAKSASIDASGGSRVEAGDFYVSSAGVDLSGGSHLTITVSDSLTGHASGGSRIDVSGLPVTEIEYSGGSTSSALTSRSD